MLRQLLSGRRQLLGKLNSVRSRDGREPPHVVSADDLQEALRGMQHRPAAPVMSHGRATARNIGHLKQDMLALLRRVSPNQEAPALAEEHNDAIDLVGMLYDNLGRGREAGQHRRQPADQAAGADDARGAAGPDLLHPPGPPGAADAQRDRRDRQPTGSATTRPTRRWSTQMNSIVDRAVHEYRGDPGVFHNVLQRTGRPPADAVAQGRGGRTPARRGGAGQGKADPGARARRRQPSRRWSRARSCRASPAPCSARPGPT